MLFVNIALMFNMFSFRRSPRRAGKKKRTHKYPARAAKKDLPTITEEDHNLDPQPQALSEEVWEEEADPQISCQGRQERPAYHHGGSPQPGPPATGYPLVPFPPSIRLNPPPSGWRIRPLHPNRLGRSL